MQLNNVPDIVRAFRVKHGIRLKDLASQLRISPAYMSYVENGKKGLSKARIDSLREIFAKHNESTEELDKAYAGEIKLFKTAELSTVLRRVVFHLINSGMSDAELLDLEKLIMEKSK